MEDIFTLQWRLNTYTLNKIGVAYAATLRDPELTPVWLENYRKALSAELAELVREVRESGIGTANGKIEIVDMLHFLVSLSHLTAVEPAQLPPPGGRAASFEACALEAFLALDDLQNSVKWKWWAQGGGYRQEAARGAVMDLWRRFHELCALFGMNLEAVKTIYIAKNQVNFRRQDQHYNEDTKTEQDNQAIERMIAGRMGGAA